MIVVEKHGSDAVSLTFPYSPEFLADMKRVVDYRFREWKPGKKVWVVKAAVFDKVHELFDQHFPGVELKVAEAAAELIRKKYESGVNYRSPKAPVSWGPYKELYLDEDAPDCVVNAAYKALARMYHPDLGGDTEIMSRINRAYEAIQTLRDAGRVNYG